MAQAEIRAPRPIHFPSESQTDAARLAAANAIPPQYEQIAPPADIASRQLKAFDLLVGGVTPVLQQRDKKALSGDALTAKLSDATQNRLTSAQISQLAAMSVAHWKQVQAAGRAVLAATQATAVREEDMAAIRVDVHNAITNDLGVSDRQLAGDLAASFLSPNQRISTALTEQARQAARDKVEPVEVQVRQNEVIVRAGDPITSAALWAHPGGQRGRYPDRG